MNQKEIFQCAECKIMIKKNKQTIGSSFMCCGKPMKKMPDPESCEISNTAEDYRLFRKDDPCDDGTT